MEEELRKQIDTIVDSIYRYDVEGIMVLISKLSESMVEYLKYSTMDIIYLSEILALIEQAIKNKDYMLLADLLKFELAKNLPNNYLS